MNIRQSFIFLSLGLLLIGSTNCKAPKHSPAAERSKAETQKIKEMLEAPENIEYSHIQNLVLNSSCNSCHNTSQRKDNVVLDSFSAMNDGTFKKVIVPYSPEESSIFKTLIASGKRHMPPMDEPQLTEDQINLVYSWVENGAKEFAADIVKRPLTLKEQLKPYFEKPETIDYPVIKEHLLSLNCMDCHSENGSKPDDDAIIYGGDLTDYAGIFSPFNPIVVKGRPKDSKIYESTSINQSMPSVKDGYDPVNSLRLKLLRLWILNCAIEDLEAIEDDQLTHDPKNPEKVRKCADLQPAE